MGPESVDVVIPNYHTALLAVQAAQSARSEGAKSIIVVENGSRDDSLPILRKEINDFAKIISLPENLGYAGACNRGAKAGKLPLILFMNSDAILQSGALLAMIEVLDKMPQVGVVGSALYYPDGRPQASAWHLVTPRRIVFSLLGIDRLAHLWPGLSANEDWRRNGDYSGEVESLLGACILCRRKAIEEVGGWDEVYHSSCEDSDFILRLSKKGWKPYREPKAKVTHIQGVSTRQFVLKSLIAFQEARWFYAQRHFNLTGKVITILASIVGMSLRLLFARTAVERKGYFAALGVWLGWTSAEEKKW